MAGEVENNQLLIFTPRNIFNFLAACFCFVMGWLFIIYPWYISFGILFGLGILFLTFAYPLFGFYLFLTVVYLRPQDFVPGLGAIGTTRLVALLMLVSFATKMILTRQPFTISKQNKYLLIFTVVMLVSSGTSGWPANSLEKWFDFVKKVLTFFVLVNLVDNRKRFKFAINFYILINFIVAGTYAVQYFTGYGYAEGRLMSVTAGFLGNADEIAITFIVSLPLAVAHYLEYDNIFAKSYFGAGAFLLFFATILTMSRGALLSVFAVIFILFYMHRQHLKKVRLYMVIFFLIIALGALFRLRLTIMDMLNRSADFDDPAVTGRFDAWNTAFKIIRSHPILGVGRANFVNYWAANYPAGGWGQRQVAHNIILQVAAETGLLSLFFYLAYSLQCLVDWFKRISVFEVTNDEEEYLVEVMRCLVISVLGFYGSGQFITIGFYWHIFLLVGFYVAAERSLYQTNDVSGRQR